MTTASIFTSFVVSIFAVAIAASLNFACPEFGQVASAGGADLAAATGGACGFLIF